jgi:hypothetical protein
MQIPFPGGFAQNLLLQILQKVFNLKKEKDGLIV